MYARCYVQRMKITAEIEQRDLERGVKLANSVLAQTGFIESTRMLLRALGFDAVITRRPGPSKID